MLKLPIRGGGFGGKTTTTSTVSPAQQTLIDILSPLEGLLSEQVGGLFGIERTSGPEPVRADFRPSRADFQEGSAGTTDFKQAVRDGNRDFQTALRDFKAVKFEQTGEGNIIGDIQETLQLSDAEQALTGVVGESATEIGGGVGGVLSRLQGAGNTAQRGDISSLLGQPLLDQAPTRGDISTTLGAPLPTGGGQTQGTGPSRIGAFGLPAEQTFQPAGGDRISQQSLQGGVGPSQQFGRDDLSAFQPLDVESTLAPLLRQFEEQTLPAIRSKAIQLGAPGGSREGGLTEQALRALGTGAGEALGRLELGRRGQEISAVQTLGGLGLGERGQDITQALGFGGLGLQQRGQDIGQRQQDISQGLGLGGLGLQQRGQTISGLLGERAQDIGQRGQDLSQILGQRGLGIQETGQTGSLALGQRGQQLQNVQQQGQFDLDLAGLLSQTGLAQRGQQLQDVTEAGRFGLAADAGATNLLQTQIGGTATLAPLLQQLQTAGAQQAATTGEAERQLATQSTRLPLDLLIQALGGTPSPQFAPPTVTERSSPGLGSVIGQVGGAFIGAGGVPGIKTLFGS